MRYLHSAVIPAQRPLSFRPKFVIGDESMPVVGLAPGMLWASIELMKHMATGHEVDSLGQFFASLTVNDCSALSLAINGAGAAALGMGMVRPAADVLTAIQGAAPYRRVAEDFKFWNMATGSASFSTTFDSMSSRRRDIIANALHASVYRVHPEEFQARCASRELPSPFAEADAVALHINKTVGEQFRSEASAVLFLRLYRGGKESGTAVLFSARRWVAMDAFGRISEVRLLTNGARILHMYAAEVLILCLFIYFCTRFPAEFALGGKHAGHQPECLITFFLPSLSSSSSVRACT